MEVQRMEHEQDSIDSNLTYVVSWITVQPDRDPVVLFHIDRQFGEGLPDL